MKKILFPAAILGSLLLPLFAGAVTVGPVKLEYKVDPGATVEGRMFVQNDESSTKVFYPSFERFTEVDGEKTFTKESSDLSSWFRMPESVTLKPGEAKNIDFKVDVPKDAHPGGHFAVIWWSTAKPGTSVEQVSVVTRAGVLVYMTVSGNVKESAEVVLKMPGLIFGFPADFSLQVKNTGDSYITPQGELLIKNIFGVTRAEIPVNQFGSSILPGSSKDFDGKLAPVSWLFGPYHAVLKMNYGEGKNLEASSWIFAFPLKTSVYVILGLILIFFVIPFALRRYNEWILARAGSGSGGKSRKTGKK